MRFPSRERIRQLRPLAAHLQHNHRMNTFSRRALFAAALATVPALLAMRNNAVAAPAPTVARFHLALSKSEPAANDTVAAPTAIKLWFTESVTMASTAVQVSNSAKKIVSTGALSIAQAPKAPVVVGLVTGLKPGKYTVDWKTMADDGHPTKGTFDFTIGAKAAK